MRSANELGRADEASTTNDVAPDEATVATEDN